MPDDNPRYPHGDYDRGEVWLLGLGLGLCADAGLLLAAVARGLAFTVGWLPIGVSVTTLGLCGLPLAVYGARGLWMAFWTIRQTQDDWQHRFSVPVAAAPEPAEKEPEYDAEEQAWRVALDRFFRAGETAGGFSAGKLSGVAGSDAWPRLVHFYASEQGGNVLRDAGSNVGHTWGHGWTLDRVMLALGNGRLPHPDMPVPVIEPFVLNTTQRRAARSSARVVDGASKPLTS